MPIDNIENEESGSSVRSKLNEAIDLLNAGGAGGEVNTSSNDGVGAGLAKTKVGVDLPFKSLLGGTDITLADGTDEVTINYTGSGGTGHTITQNDVAVTDQPNLDFDGTYLTATDNPTDSATDIRLSGAVITSLGLADSAQQPPSEGAFANGDKTKLDAITGTNTGDQDAAGVAFTPAGGIIATDVQAAIEEVDSGKEVSTLTDAGDLLGTELAVLDSGGAAVSTTTSKLLGEPFENVMGYDRERLSFFSHLMGAPGGTLTTPTPWSASADGDMFGSDPMACYFNGTGATVDAAGVLAFRYGAAECKTGTTATGRAACVSSWQSILMVHGTTPFDCGFIVNLSAAPSSGGQSFTAYVGLFNDYTAAPTEGRFFRCDETNANWFAVTLEGGVETSATDTGVAANSTWHAFKIVINPDTPGAEYQIDNGTTILHGTAANPGVGFAFCGVAIRKTALTTSRSISIDAIRMNMPGVDLTTKPEYGYL